ncbi:MAG: methyltransferase [Oscillospiraceae bacterium]|jgi:hypothetical protein|nr:methyltransferase [Oscillospiraceae bacterium]
MSVPKFDPKELNIVSEISSFPGAPTISVYSFPVTPREAVIAMYKREAVWQITGMEQKMFNPRINPDNIVKALVSDGPGRLAAAGGKDIFGIEWEYVAQVGGSTVRPGTPFLADANEWYDKVVWPDIDSWDWAGAAKENEQYLATDNYVISYLFTGWYERLISFMDFEPAIMAMVDEDQTDAVKALFDKLSDLYIRIIDKYLEYFPQIDGFCVHDDWGSQKDTFFSPAIVTEMIVPYMKRVTDHLHSKGKFCDLHSCGQLFKQIPNIIAAGWDSWSGQLEINDFTKLYDAFGDKLIIGIATDPSVSPAASEDELRAAAVDFADKFCDAKKPSMLNFYSNMSLPRVFREELYIRSREHYSA